MMLGVAVGVATAGGPLYLVVRYRFAQFDQAAATAFTDLFTAQLPVLT
jgi:hypothetical protein